MRIHYSHTTKCLRVIYIGSKRWISWLRKPTNQYEKISVSLFLRLCPNFIYQLNHLLDLKQKQANVSEALSARKQAENTSRQAELSAQHAAEGVVQAELAREQAEATAQQGRTVLVFTVVTIIFVCSTPFYLSSLQIEANRK